MSPSRVMPALFDQDVDPAQLRDDPLDRRADLLRVGHVGLAEGDLPARGRGSLLHLRERLAGVQVDEHDARTLAKEIHHDFLPDSPGAPGHDCILSLQKHLRPPFIPAPQLTSFAISSHSACRPAAHLRTQRAHQACEDRARAGLVKSIEPVREKTLLHRHPADHGDDLPDAQLPRLGGRSYQPARHVGVYRRFGFRESEPGECLGKAFRCFLHQGAVEGTRDLEPHDPPRAGGLERGLGLCQPRCRPRQDHLPGAVVVGEVHARLRERLDRARHGFGRKPQHRGHARRARAGIDRPGCLLHEPATDLHDREHVPQPDHPRFAQGGIFPEAEPRAPVERDPLFLQHGARGKVHQRDRRLGLVRGLQFLGAGLGQQPLHVHLCGLGGLLEQRAHRLAMLPQVHAHACVLGALPGEEEAVFHDRGQYHGGSRWSSNPLF